MLEIEGGRNNKKAFVSVRDLAKNTKIGVRRALHKSGIGLIREFKNEVRTGTKTGRFYGAHRASAPGETPANITGVYARGIDFRVSASQLLFGNTAPHAGWLEAGTITIKPRFGLLNALKSEERNILRNFALEIQREL